MSKAYKQAAVRRLAAYAKKERERKERDESGK